MAAMYSKTRLQFIAFLLCLVSIPILGTTLQAQQWQDLYEPVNDSQLPCRIMTPVAIENGVKYPVVLSLHGAGGKGVDNKKQLKGWNKQLAQNAVRTKFPCYVVAPQADQLWNKGHYEEVKKIISRLPQIDKSRIYILGHSMGGHGTYIFLQFERDYFAAGAPSAGTGLRTTTEFINSNKIQHYPIWAFHGDKDSVCPFSKQQKVFDEVKRLHGNLKLTIWIGDNHGVSAKFIPGADNGKTIYSSGKCDREEDFLTWLFEQKRDESM